MDLSNISSRVDWVEPPPNVSIPCTITEYRKQSCDKNSIVDKIFVNFPTEISANLCFEK